MPRDAFLEILLPVPGDDENAVARDVIEEAVDEALAEAGVGEVTGAGSGVEMSIVDVEVTDFDRALPIIRSVLQGLRVPSSVRISHNEGDFSAGAGKRTYYSIYD